MITTLIVLAIVVAYVAVGAFYARTQALAVYARARGDDPMPVGAASSSLMERHVQEDVKMMLAWRVALWPYAVPFDALRAGVLEWFTAPISDRKQRVDQLRADAEEWDRKRYEGTTEERRMATELAKLCRERAKELRI